MPQVEVEIIGMAITHRYGTLQTGTILRTDADYAKHLVEECGAAKYKVAQQPKAAPTLVTKVPATPRKTAAPTLVTKVPATPRKTAGKVDKTPVAGSEAAAGSEPVGAVDGAGNASQDAQASDQKAAPDLAAADSASQPADPTTCST